jgi:hypothetical protein
MSQSNVSSWLPGLLGVLGLSGTGGPVATLRSKLNFVGCTVVDNPGLQQTDITPPGAVAPATSPLAALAIDWSVSGSFSKTLAAGANTLTFANQTSGAIIVVRLTGAASTVTWPTVKWAGGVAPVQTASGTDVYTFFYDGTTIYGSVVQAFA